MSRDTRLYLAWLVALVATLGSLYYSELRGFGPCPLCWFQRIFMYPLAIVLGIAAFLSDYSIRRYVIPLAVVGLGFALFQNLEVWGIVTPPKACTVNANALCDTPWPVWGNGSPLNTILTIPVQSLIAFTLIIALLSWPRSQALRDEVSVLGHVE